MEEEKMSMNDVFDGMKMVHKREELDVVIDKMVDDALKYVIEKEINGNGGIEGFAHVMILKGYIESCREFRKNLNDMVKEHLSEEEDRIIREGE